MFIRYLLAICFFLSAAFGLASKAYGAVGGTAGDPFTTLSDAYTVGSGRYFFNTGSGLFEADVDNSEGGGWVLVLQYVHKGGTGPNLNVIGAAEDLPVLSTGVLGDDESANATKFAHAGTAAMSQFTGDIELRWYGETSNHGRIMHFRSSVGDDYVRTGNVPNGFSGIESSFTALSGHSANLPASATAFASGEGDLALTHTPFTSASYRWNVRHENGNEQWEVDNDIGDTSQDTIHRVWVRQVKPLEVTNTADTGEGSLRQAIIVANANTALDDITFNIPGAGPHIISPTSALPSITDDNVTLDASSQAGALCRQLTTGSQHDLQIQIDGTSAGESVSGLEVSGSDVSVQGLSISNFDSFGVSVIFGGNNFIAECLYLGVAPDGITKGPNAKASNRTPSIRLFNVTNGTVRNSLISGNDNDAFDKGLRFARVTGGLIEGNIIGLNAAGSSSLSNGDEGIFIDAATSDIIIGGATVETRNVISGNGGFGVDIEDVSNITLLGNYIGTNIDGVLAIPNDDQGVSIKSSNMVVVGGTGSGEGNLISGNDSDGMIIDTVTDASILGNVIGTNTDGTSAIANVGNGIEIINSDVNIGNGTIVGRNIIAGNTGANIFYSNSTSRVNGNFIGIGTGEEAIGGASGVLATGTSEIQILNNTIAHHTNSGNGVGVQLSSAAKAAIYSNSIFSNELIGIDLNFDFGSNSNDVGDADSGANDLLNFPVINSFSGDDTTLYYDFNLDVPSNGFGYRIEFFKNDTASASGYGEGQTFLGFVEEAHSGGDVNFSGNFTGNTSINQGDLISAVTTRITGASEYDISSEFSLIATSTAPTELTAEQSSQVYDPASENLYSVPGNDVVTSLTVTNVGSAEVSSDSIFIAMIVAEEITFYNDDIDDGGPETNPISFAQTGGANLTFDYTQDAGFSNGLIKPTSLSSCNYTPASGYDDNVTYICVAPKGAMADGNPDPTFTIAYRAMIE